MFLLKKIQKLIIKLLIIIIPFFMISLMIGCILPEAPAVTPTIENISVSADSENIEFTISWKTETTSESKLYFGTTQDNLDCVRESTSGNNYREVVLAGLYSETDYYFKIDSTLLEVTVESGVLNFYSGSSTNYKIIGETAYTEVYQSSGSFIVELWDSSHSYDYAQGPIISQLYSNTGSFELIVQKGLIYNVRVFRDFNLNGVYDTETDAIYVYPTDIEIIDLSITDIGILTLVEPSRSKASIDICDVSSYAVNPGSSIDIIYHLKDQWGGLYTGSSTESISLTSTNTDVSLSTNGTIDSDADGIITTTVTIDTASSLPQYTSIQTDWTGTSNSITSSSITVLDISSLFQITGSFTYTQAYQPSGPFIVELWDSVDAFNYGVGPLSTKLVTSPGSFSFDVMDGNSYKIRIFRDYNSNLQLDAAFDAAYTHGVTITISGADADIGSPALTEPARIKNSVDISSNYNSSIQTGSNFDIVYNIKDQWDGLYTGFATESLNISSSNANVSLVAAGTTDSDADGIITANITLSTATPPQDLIITGTWNGVGASVDTSNISVTGLSTGYTISGSFTYTQVYQPTGWFIAELWNSADAFNYGVGPLEAKLYTSVANFNFNVVDGNSYKIRIFRDYNNDAQYDENTLDAGYTFVDPITISGSSVNLGAISLTEPTRTKDHITINSMNQTVVISGETLNIEYALKDQWDQLYTTTPPPNETLSLTASNSVVVSPTSISDSDGDGIIPATLTLTHGSPPISSIITATWDSTITVDSSAVSVVGSATTYDISGIVTYNVASPEQPIGTDELYITAYSNYDGIDPVTGLHTFSGIVAGPSKIIGGSGNSYSLTLPAGSTIYLLAYKDYNNAGDGYTSTTDGYGMYGAPTSIYMDSDKLNYDVEIYLEPTRKISSIVINNDNTPWTYAYGGSWDVQINTYDQWGIMYGDDTVIFSISQCSRWNKVTTSPALTPSGTTQSATLTSGNASMNITFYNSSNGTENLKLKVEIGSDPNVFYITSDLIYINP